MSYYYVKDSHKKSEMSEPGVIEELVYDPEGNGKDECEVLGVFFLCVWWVFVRFS